MYLFGNRSRLLRALMCVFSLLLVGCNATEERSDNDTSVDASAGDADTDTDTDTDVDADAGCGPDEWICVGNDVHEKSCIDGTTALIEECGDDRYCFEGACYFEGACGEAEQMKSNIGCEYWAVDLDNYEGNAADQPFVVAVGNVGEEIVNVKVETRLSDGSYAVVTQQEVPAKDVGVFRLTGEGVTLSPMLSTIAGSYLQERWAYRITSDLPVIAYQFNPYSGLTEENSQICSNDASLLIPSSGIDKHYFALAYPPNADVAAVNIVATEDNTTVSVTPTAPIIGGPGLPGMMAGTTYEILMNASDVAQLESDGDISGTYIEADKPIVVFAGNVLAFVPQSVSYGDHLEQQMIPLSKWGMEYIAARSKIRSNKQNTENDHYRIIASKDGTVIETEPQIQGFPVTLNRGEVFQVKHASSFAIKGSEPIMVGQFIAGSDATGLPSEARKRGDPSYALLAPVEQFLKEYVFLAPDKYPFDYVVITHPTNQDIELDKAPLSSHGDCEVEEIDADWTVTRCEIGDFTHTISSAEPVGITVWGYGVNVSYGYTGGMSLETINPVVK
ncbi:MAG: hypothetical protein GY854_29155 [Deltaproteobacteria bacterium]|nr:hypothetical protein [Deltaproteobacteria bacterium]